MLKSIGLLFAALGLAYFLFYPFLKNAVNRKKLFKWFIIAYVLAVLAATVGSYSKKARQPDSFEAGVEMMKNDRRVLDKIGVYKSLKFNKEDLPAETDNPADLKFMLEGSTGTILMETKVAREKQGDWYLLQIKRDSLVEKY